MRAIFALPGAVELHSRSRDSVNQIYFELAKSLPKLRPLWSVERFRLVRGLVETGPNATLKELCDCLQQERGIAASVSSVSRASKQ